MNELMVEKESRLLHNGSRTRRFYKTRVNVSSTRIASTAYNGLTNFTSSSSV